MPLGQSRSTFLPDDRLKLRAPGNSALTGVFHSAAIDLNRLTPFWNTNEWGVAQDLQFAVKIESMGVAAGQAYTFTLEVDSVIGFGSALVVDTVVVTAGTPSFDLALTRESLLLLKANAQYIRLSMTPANGDEVGTITLTDFLVETDRYTLSDGTNTGLIAKIGTMQTGSIAFSGTMADGDIYTIDDGVSGPLAFTFGNGTGGTVDKGASATASAQNLKAAINASALYVLASGASTTITIKNLRGFTGGSIVETTDSASRGTVVNFAGGVAGVKTKEMIQKATPGATFAAQATLIAAAIQALNSSGSFTATASGGVITVLNTLAGVGLGAPTGGIVETQDTGNVSTVVDFAVTTPSIQFWSYVRGANAKM